MNVEIIELQQKIEILTQEKAEYFSAKQSLNRLSARLRKLCKRLTPTSETTVEMQKIADEIRDLVKKIT